VYRYVGRKLVQGFQQLAEPIQRYAIDILQLLVSKFSFVSATYKKGAYILIKPILILHRIKQKYVHMYVIHTSLSTTLQHAKWTSEVQKYR